jgi:hypothetical protein
MFEDKKAMEDRRKERAENTAPNIQAEKDELQKNESRRRVLEARLAATPNDLAAGNELDKVNDNINKQQEHIRNFEKYTGEFDVDIENFDKEIKKADGRLKKIDDKYLMGDDEAENNKVREAIREKEQKNKDYADENGNILFGRNSATINQHIVNNIQPKINQIKNVGDQRGEDFVKLNYFQRQGHKLGITTAQTHMARDAREKGRKSKKDKFFDTVIKEAKKQGLDDLDTLGGPSVPPAPKTPPPTSPSKFPSNP